MRPSKYARSLGRSWANFSRISCALTLSDFENARPQRRIEIAVRANLNPPVSALLDERWQPANLELAADDDEDVGFLQLQNEAWLRFDEVRILIPFRDRLHRNVVPADFARDSGQV